jgi:poly-gamma-glutamate synthesis protein (capsule biosynthesis protein)
MTSGRVRERRARERARLVRRRRRNALATVGGVAWLIGLIVGAGAGSSSGARLAPRKLQPAKASPRLSPSWRGDGHAVTLAFGGDVHFEDELAARLASSPANALDGVSALTSGADISMANFESALTDGGGCPDPQPKQYVFHAPPSALTALKDAHLTLVTEANNHGDDCGATGVRQSVAIAQAAHYPVIGIGDNAAQAFAPYTATIDGQRIAIIAATDVIDSNLVATWTAASTQPGLASAQQEAELVAAVQDARRTADTVIVYLHWGTEKEDCPNAEQGPLATALVRAGADIVLGAHAHVQLGAGYLGSALVDYGLGNLAFYDHTPPEDYSGALIVKVTGRHIDSFQWRPALLENDLPVLEHGADATVATQRWQGLRSCTGLAGTPGTSLASAASERAPFVGSSSSASAGVAQPGE